MEQFSLSNYKAPCKNCKERELGCHSKCPKYLEFKKLNEEIKKQKKEESKERDYYYHLYHRKKGK